MKRMISIFIICLIPSPAWGTNWFVRPYTNPNQYGSSDGTSYGTAWNGFSSVVWGSGGVTAGDTLWVCGVHDGSYTNNVLTVGASGTASQHITVRGNCSSINPLYSDGTVWLTKAKYPVGYSWRGPDAYGVYSTTQFGQSNTIPAIEDRINILTNKGKIPDDTWTAGSYYQDTTNGVFYYKPTNGAASDHLVYSSVYVKSFVISNHDYIDVKNITWGMGGAAAIYISGASHITLDNLSMAISRYGIESINDGSTNLVSNYDSITNCTIHDVGEGISNSTAASVTSDFNSYWTISGNTIYNVNRSDISDPDRHAIGLQGVRHFTISNNLIHDIGGPSPATDKAAIDLYSRTPNMYVDDNVVTRNLIDNAFYGGICLESNNACVPDKMKNNIIAYNIIRNGGSSSYGIAWKSFRASDGSPSAKIYNNTVYNCNVSYKAIEYSFPGDVYLTSYDFENNISYYPISKHFYYYPYYSGRNRGNWSAITQDDNLYYPDGDYFSWNSTKYLLTFGKFKKASGKDTHSINRDPLFVSTSDFHLLPTSPAIKAGADVGLAIDFDGKVVPKAYAPSIGAYEYMNVPSTSAPANPTELQVIH